MIGFALIAMQKSHFSWQIKRFLDCL